MTGNESNQQRQLNFEDREQKAFSELTLEQLVKIANGAELLLDNPNQINPETLIGQLILSKEVSEEFRAAQRKKIDGIDSFVSSLMAVADLWEQREKRAYAKKKAVKNIIENFLNYVKHQMIASKSEELIGYESKIVNRQASNPGVVVFVDLDDEKAITYNELVTFVPASYHWNDSAFRDQLKPFYKILAEREACETCGGSCRMRRASDDSCELVDCNDCNGTGKNLSGLLDIPKAFEIARLEWSRFIKFEDYVPNAEITKKRQSKKKAAKK